MDFDFDHIETTEFGVGVTIARNRGFFTVPAHQTVAGHLNGMVHATIDAMNEVSLDPTAYSPANSVPGWQHLSVAIDDEMAAVFRDLINTDNFVPRANILQDQDAQRVFCYFARLTDGVGRRLIAMRRATTFKGFLNPRNRVVRWIDDALQFTEGNQFKLDNDFDLLVAEDELRVLRQRGLEAIAQLQQAIKDAVPGNIDRMRASMPFVNLDGIAAAAVDSIRAARILSSIMMQGITGVTLLSLQNECRQKGVQIVVNDGTVTVPEAQIWDFLDTLDRRRWRSSLLPHGDEFYRASTRRRV